jgi:hypothetical protein
MLVIDHDYWAQAYANEPGPGTIPLAEEVESRTTPDERVGVVGLDWSPAVLYYANRWGHMVVERNREAAFDAIEENDYRYLLLADPAGEDLTSLSRWPWIGSIGPHSYAIAADATGVAGSQLVATDDPRALTSRGRPLGRAMRIPCGTATRVPSGRRGTLLRLTDPSPGVRLGASDDLGPVPGRRWIFVGPSLAGAGSLTLTCSGRAALVVDAYDAPLPW